MPRGREIPNFSDLLTARARSLYFAAPGFESAKGSIKGLHDAINRALKTQGIKAYSPRQLQRILRGNVPVPENILLALSIIFPDVDLLTVSSDAMFHGMRRWRAAAAEVATDRITLTENARQYYSFLSRPVEIDEPFNFPLLRKANWILPRPVPLHTVQCRFDSFVAHPPIVRLPEAGVLYSAILRQMKRDDQDLWDGDCYRLVDVAIHGKGKSTRVELTFGAAKYFDFVDTVEVVAAELATAISGLAPGQKLLFRKDWQHAFELRTRSAVAGLNCLLVFKRYRPPGSTGQPYTAFVVHDRRRTHSGGAPTGMEAQNVLHVVPAGTFQPIAEADGDRERDFSLLRAIAREFAEELFGIKELASQRPDLGDPFERGVGSKIIEKLNDEQLTSIHFLGVGLDPLNTKPELLFVIVTDWQKLIERTDLKLKPNAEGRLQFIKLSSRSRLLEQANDKHMLAAGAACLLLAHEHFSLLSIE